MRILLKNLFLALFGAIISFCIVKIISLQSNLMPTVTTFAALEPQPVNFVLYFGSLLTAILLFLYITEFRTKLLRKKSDTVISSLESGWSTAGSLIL